MTNSETFPPSSITVDGFSPRNLILQGKEFFSFLLGKWKWILIVSGLFGLAAVLYTFLQQPAYEAEITFALDEKAAESPSGGLADIAASLWLEPRSANGGTLFSSMANVMQLMQSRLLIEKTLRKSIRVNGKNLLFADFFLDSLHYRDTWLKGRPNKNPDFSVVKKTEEEQRFENGIFRNIYHVLVSKMIRVQQLGKGGTILSATCTTENESFSRYFLETLLNEVTQFYIEQKTERSRLTLAVLEKRLDSVRTAYFASLSGRAAFTDAFINPSRQLPMVPAEKQQTDIQVIRTAYVELTRSIEVAKTALMTDTPIIQYLDIPVFPLKKISGSMTKRFLFFFVLGAFLSVVYFFFRFLLTRILNT